MQGSNINDQEFGQFQQWLYNVAGISLTPAKKALVCGRLAKRLRHYHLETYGAYYSLLISGQQPEEVQIALDLLTTNETYFFREPRHFQYLRETILPLQPRGKPVRIWSAACSTGEEPYTLAMVLASHFDSNAQWEVLGSDVSSRVLEVAQRGQYPLERAKDIPKELLSKYCLKGVRSQEGMFRIGDQLMSRVRFMQVNLNRDLPKVGEMDVIFLRNVLIYFDAPTKRQVIGRLADQLRPGGHFIVGHSESLHGLTETMTLKVPTIYWKPAS